MIFFYIDGAGNLEKHNEPLFDGQTPLFCLSAIALHSSSWRKLNTSLLNLKRSYFSSEMEYYARKNSYRHHRSEHYEVKGGDLFKPSNAKNRRRQTFASKVIELIESLDAVLFSVIWRKNPDSPVEPISIYTTGLQILSERFQYYLEEVNDAGIMVVDATSQTIDFRVGASHLSFVFGHTTGRQYTSLIEAPLFVDSKLSSGTQLADIIGGAIYGYYYKQLCSQIPGLFDKGGNPINPKQYASNQGGSWEHRTPARDYSQCEKYWPRLDSMQFKRTGVSPPSPGHVVPGYYGFRVIDLKRP